MGIEEYLVQHPAVKMTSNWLVNRRGKNSTCRRIRINILFTHEFLDRKIGKDLINFENFYLDLSKYRKKREYSLERMKIRLGLILQVWEEVLQSTENGEISGEYFLKRDQLETCFISL